MAPMLAGLPLALLALLGRLWWGSWLAPGALFALYWTAGIFLPLALAPEDRVGAGAVLWVVAAGIAVFVGALLGGGPHAGQRSALESSQPRYGPLRSEVARYAWLAGWCTLLGLGAGILALVSAGFTLKTVFAIERLVVVAHAFSVARYGFDYRPPLVSQALLMFAYAAPLFGGVLAATRVRRGHLWLALLTLLPALAITVTQTTKASTIAAVVMWLSAYFATRLACGQPEVFTRRHVTGGASALGGMVVLFLVVGLARLGSVNLARLATDVLPGFKVSALGYLPAFSTWLGAAGFDLRVPSLGVYTFAGPFELRSEEHTSELQS